MQAKEKYLQDRWNKLSDRYKRMFGLDLPDRFTMAIVLWEKQYYREKWEGMRDGNGC